MLVIISRFQNVVSTAALCVFVYSICCIHVDYSLHSGTLHLCLAYSHANTQAHALRLTCLYKCLYFIPRQSVRQCGLLLDELDEKSVVLYDRVHAQT